MGLWSVKSGDAQPRREHGHRARQVRRRCRASPEGTLSRVRPLSARRYGIVVASVAPGFVETDRVAAKVAGDAGAAVRAQSSWNRVAAPAEVAEAVAFAAAFWRVPWITGAVLDVNGASYLRV